MRATAHCPRLGAPGNRPATQRRQIQPTVCVHPMQSHRPEDRKPRHSGRLTHSQTRCRFRNWPRAFPLWRIRRSPPIPQAARNPSISCASEISSTARHCRQERRFGENAEHLAHAEADLDRDNLAAAISETERLSGPAARVMSKWLADARVRIAQRYTTPATRLAQATPQKRAWPDVMPTEVPPFARESSGPPPAP